jgi:hypothetical protein
VAVVEELLTSACEGNDAQHHAAGEAAEELDPGVLLPVLGDRSGRLLNLVVARLSAAVSRRF